MRFLEHFGLGFQTLLREKRSFSLKVSGLRSPLVKLELFGCDISWDVNPRGQLAQYPLYCDVGLGLGCRGLDINYKAQNYGKWCVIYRYKVPINLSLQFAENKIFSSLYARKCIYIVSQKNVSTFELCVTLSNLNRFSKFCTAEKRMKFAKNPYDNTHFTLGMLLHYLGKLKSQISFLAVKKI